MDLNDLKFKRTRRGLVCTNMKDLLEIATEKGISDTKISEELKIDLGTVRGWWRNDCAMHESAKKLLSYLNSKKTVEQYDDQVSINSAGQATEITNLINQVELLKEKRANGRIVVISQMIEDLSLEDQKNILISALKNVLQKMEK